MLRRTGAGPGPRGLLAASLVLAMLSGAASADLITFEEDVAIGKGNSFQSVESNRVSFVANFPPFGIGGLLAVADLSPSTTGNALLVGPNLDTGEEPAATNILSLLFFHLSEDEFEGPIFNPVDSLRFTFGDFGFPLGDPPPPGTVAGLIVANLDVTDLDNPSFQEIGRAIVPLDNNPAANQVIRFGAPGGPPFNLAAFGLFSVADESLTPVNAIEVVDNIDFHLATAVPEPSTLTLSGLGLLAAAVGATRRLGRCRAAGFPAGPR
jgi:PEP-CTERM motif